jgi:hypothetical protein
MKVIAWLIGIGTFLMAIFYMVVSLNRWEWDRALFFGMIALITEIALATAIILRRLDRRMAPPVTSTLIEPPAALATVRSTRPPSPNRFAWLDGGSHMGVFITFLVGGGVILSGIAWLVDRVAARTVTPLAEQQLAQQLQSIEYARGGLLLDDVTVLAQSVPGCDDEQLERLLRRAGHGRA